MTAKSDIKVKICGLTRPEDVAAALENGADFLGFIVEAKSSRRLSVTKAASLARPAIGIARRVAVTVNADNDLLQSIMEQMQPDLLQCHGDESPHRVAFIRSAFHVPVIKALPVKTQEDLEDIAKYKRADYILLDAKPPKAFPKVRGGHGVSFDWDILNGADLPDNLIIAGGLNPKNAGECLNRTNARILDVSSGVERKPGIKDPAKIKAFMEAVKHG